MARGPRAPSFPRGGGQHETGSARRNSCWPPGWGRGSEDRWGPQEKGDAHVNQPCGPHPATRSARPFACKQAAGPPPQAQPGCPCAAPHSALPTHQVSAGTGWGIRLSAPTTAPGIANYRCTIRSPRPDQAQRHGALQAKRADARSTINTSCHISKGAAQNPSRRKILCRDRRPRS